MHPAALVAMGYDYPTSTSVEKLTTAIESSELRGVVRRRMDDFVAAIRGLPLGVWEELHTATLDLSPLFVPYVGHVQWGENYRRGEFMAELKRDMEQHGVDLRGELPDHVEPVLRYLAAADEPLSDLMEVLSGTVATMAKTLEKAAPDNPYRYLLAATLGVVEDQNLVVIGGDR